MWRSYFSHSCCRIHFTLFCHKLTFVVIYTPISGKLVLAPVMCHLSPFTNSHSHRPSPANSPTMNNRLVRWKTKTKNLYLVETFKKKFSVLKFSWYNLRPEVFNPPGSGSHCIGGYKWKTNISPYGFFQWKYNIEKGSPTAE